MTKMTMKKAVPAKPAITAKVATKTTTKIQPKPKSDTITKVNKMIEETAAKKVKNDNELTVSQVAESIGMDPKVARAKLRRLDMKSVDGRWPTITKGSKEHTKLIEVLKGATAKKAE